MKSAEKKPSTWFRPQLVQQGHDPITGDTADWKKVGRHENQFIGRTIYNQSTLIESNEKILNKILKVKITNSTNFALECQI